MNSPTACCNAPVPLNTAAAVRERYSAAARTPEAALCCPVSYDARYLAAIPQEVLDKDYGCGDPSRWVRPGETVLDLGSGGGKICYIAAQVVGPQGRVIGVDCNDEMLALARRHRAAVADRLGYANVEFHRGRIHDLALDLELLDSQLRSHPVQSAADWLRLEEHADELRRVRPLVPTAAIDVIVSNCVLNLVDVAHRRQLFAEMHRVLRPGGRAVISDIVADADIPEPLRNDPQLWSGCLSGAFREDRFPAAFRAAGFGDVAVVARQAEPWAVIAGISFRSVTVQAVKVRDTAAEPPALPADLPLLTSLASPAAACCGPTGCC